MSPPGTFLKTAHAPSERVRYLFHSGNLARSWRRLRIETMAQTLGIEEHIVVRLYGPFPLPPEPDSIVYLVAHSTAPCDGEPVKIGYTRSIRMRLEQLQPGSVQKLWLATYLHGGHSLERELHESLAFCRLREDWFTMCAEVRQAFDSHRNEHWRAAA